SLLVSESTRQLRVIVHWGDYRAEPREVEAAGRAKPTAEDSGRGTLSWRRTPRLVELALDLPSQTSRTVEHEVPDGEGVRLAVSVRPVKALGIAEGMVPAGTRSVSIFLVNHRTPVQASDIWDERFIFQAGLCVHSDGPLIPRPNLRGQATDDWDERVA